MPMLEEGGKAWYNTGMLEEEKKKKDRRPPEMFRPLLWWARWEDIDIETDKEDLIVNAVNEGTIAHWRWLIDTYGKKEVRHVLERRLATEFHPESRSLAKVVFSVSDFRHARGSAH